jgi:hypothetical protein
VILTICRRHWPQMVVDEASPNEFAVFATPAAKSLYDRVGLAPMNQKLVLVFKINCGECAISFGSHDAAPLQEIITTIELKSGWPQEVKEPY